MGEKTVSKDTLIDEAREFVIKRCGCEISWGDLSPQLMADFADKIAADAVRERDEMLSEATEIHVPKATLNHYPYGWAIGGNPAKYESPLEAYRALKAAKEAQTDER